MLRSGANEILKYEPWENIKGINLVVVSVIDTKLIK